MSYSNKFTFSFRSIDKSNYRNDAFYLCSTYQKKGALCICLVWQVCFCVKYFNEHSESLSATFDHDIAETRNRFLEEIKNTDSLNIDKADLFLSNQSPGDKNDHQSFRNSGVRQRLNELLNQEVTFKNKVENLTREISNCRQEDFDKGDIE